MSNENRSAKNDQTSRKKIYKWKTGSKLRLERKNSSSGIFLGYALYGR